MDLITEFLKQSTLKEWVFLIIGAILGYLFNLIFYLMSKNSSNEKNLDKLFELYNNAVNNSSNSKVLEEIKTEIKTKNSIDNILVELSEIKEKIQLKPSEEDIVKYKLLGDQWSNVYLKTISPKILTQDGFLYYSNIMSFHKSIFPKDFIWAGKLREHNVVIKDSFGTAVETLPTATIDYNMKPIRHKEVLFAIEEYCNIWNSNIHDVMKKNTPYKIKLIARMHHEFQTIHPFLDGNGRVGRVILSDMIEFLLHKKISFNYIKEDYYAALKFADLGNIQPLVELIDGQIN